MRLLITRPEPDATRTAAHLRAIGHEVTLAPMLRVETIADASLGPGPWAAILLTSANGARALAGHPRLAELKAMPVLAVGQGSAAAARAEGFPDVTSAGGDGGDLARLAAGRLAGTPKTLLYLAGEDRARDLGGALLAHGHKVETVTIYRTVQSTSFPHAALAALCGGAIDGVLHFSRRSVEGYLACARNLLGQALRPVHYCLSARAAEPLQSAGAAEVHIAEHPDEAAMLALVASRV